MESLLSLGVAVNMENNYSNCKKKKNVKNTRVKGHWLFSSHTWPITTCFSWLKHCSLYKHVSSSTLVSGTN